MDAYTMKVLASALIFVGLLDFVFAHIVFNKKISGLEQNMLLPQNNQENAITQEKLKNLKFIQAALKSTSILFTLGGLFLYYRIT